jgi:acetate kinase
MQHILTLNGGSSSIKFALFETGDALKRLLSGKIERIGSPDTKIEFTDFAAGQSGGQPIAALDRASCIQPLVQFLHKRLSFDQITAVGHPIVHGGTRFHEPQPITADMLTYLEEISPYDPEHLPIEIAMTVPSVRIIQSSLKSLVSFGI